MPDGTKELRIHVYTRNGGGNRDCWGWDEYVHPDQKPERCICPGCCIEKILPTHPLYVMDYDDDFDCTYATIEFRIPEAAQNLVRFLMELTPETEKPEEKFMALIDKMKKGDMSDPETQRALEIGKKIFMQISGTLKP